MPSPMQRSLEHLRLREFHPAIVEKRVPRSPITQDMFGFGDIFAFNSTTKQFLIVQTTTTSHINHRMNKISEISLAKLWIIAGGEIECHGWSKKSKVRGGRKFWTLKCLQVKFRSGLLVGEEVTNV